MQAVNGMGMADGPPPPSPLTGCYLLIVLGEPHTSPHKDIILQRLSKGLLSWNLSECLVDLEKELSIVTEQGLEGEEARYGERLIQFASENLVTEILIHPSVSTLTQCIRNLLSSFTRHRHIIHAGYTFAANGSWILQDGTFSLADFSEAFQELDVQRVLHAYENGISLDIHCSSHGDWSKLPKESFTKCCKLRINPNDVLDSGSAPIAKFISYISPFLIPAELENVLESSDVVGNIRFSRPTLYIFPGGQGDAALFGINGFNMLVDGGFSRKACFWDFVRHLDRLDAVLLTRLNNSNVNGIGAVLKRKAQNAVYPQMGHFFCNVQTRKTLLSPDGDKDKDPLMINLQEEGHDLISNLKKLELSPQSCYRDSEPVNLYHKVGHGTLDMYVLNPAKDSKEVREFLHRWNNNDQKLFSNHRFSKDLMFPLQNVVSICALLVWRPANPNDTITRILFPGSAPQAKIFEGLDKLRSLECIKQSVCTEKNLAPPMKKTKENILEKLQKKPLKQPPPPPENKTVENNMKNNSLQLQNGNQVKKSSSVESDKSEAKKNGITTTTKPKTAKKPTTPKKTAEQVAPTPAKSTKDANNKKVVAKTTKKAEKIKQERKPISRRAPAPKLPQSPVKKPTNGNIATKRLKLDKDNIPTDSSTLSTPSVDEIQLIKKDLTPEEAQQLAELKEEQEAIKELEAVFRKSDQKFKEPPEEYLIVETSTKHVEETVKLARDSEESEKAKKDAELDESGIGEQETDEEERKKEPEEKISGTLESGATTTAPTLPEDERIPLNEIKEQVEEKHVKEETKEKETKEIKTVNLPKHPSVVGLRLDKETRIRDIVKTPDEVADLPVHEEAEFLVSPAKPPTEPINVTALIKEEIEKLEMETSPKEEAHNEEKETEDVEHEDIKHHPGATEENIHKTGSRKSSIDHSSQKKSTPETNSRKQSVSTPGHPSPTLEKREGSRKASLVAQDSPPKIPTPQLEEQQKSPGNDAGSKTPISGELQVHSRKTSVSHDEKLRADSIKSSPDGSRKNSNVGIEDEPASPGSRKASIGPETSQGGIVETPHSPDADVKPGESPVISRKSSIAPNEDDVKKPTSPKKSPNKSKKNSIVHPEEAAPKPPSRKTSFSQQESPANSRKSSLVQPAESPESIRKQSIVKDEPKAPSRKSSIAHPKSDETDENSKEGQLEDDQSTVGSRKNSIQSSPVTFERKGSVGIQEKSPEPKMMSEDVKMDEKQASLPGSRKNSISSAPTERETKTEDEELHERKLSISGEDKSKSPALETKEMKTPERKLSVSEKNPAPKQEESPEENKSPSPEHGKELRIPGNESSPNETITDQKEEEQQKPSVGESEKENSRSPSPEEPERRLSIAGKDEPQRRSPETKLSISEQEKSRSPSPKEPERRSSISEKEKPAVPERKLSIPEKDKTRSSSPGESERKTSIAEKDKPQSPNLIEAVPGTKLSNSEVEKSRSPSPKEPERKQSISEIEKPTSPSLKNATPERKLSISEPEKSRSPSPEEPERRPSIAKKDKPQIPSLKDSTSDRKLSISEPEKSRSPSPKEPERRPSIAEKDKPQIPSLKDSASDRKLSISEDKSKSPSPEVGKEPERKSSIAKEDKSRTPSPNVPAEVSKSPELEEQSLKNDDIKPTQNLSDQKSSSPSPTGEKEMQKTPERKLSVSEKEKPHTTPPNEVKTPERKLSVSEQEKSRSPSPKGFKTGEKVPERRLSISEEEKTRTPSPNAAPERKLSISTGETTEKEKGDPEKPCQVKPEETQETSDEKSEKKLSISEGEKSPEVPSIKDIILNQSKPEVHEKQATISFLEQEKQASIPHETKEKGMDEPKEKDEIFNVKINLTDKPEHAEPVLLKSSPESPIINEVSNLPQFIPTEIDKLELGRKSPKEREEDVAKIVASVATVLKSDAPLEVFHGKVPLTTTTNTPAAAPYGTYELRETHITCESPKNDQENDDSGTVHRMLVTASSEDGGEETEICPAGSIIFSRSSESSGRSSPELSKKSTVEPEIITKKTVTQVEGSPGLFSGVLSGFASSVQKIEDAVTESVENGLKKLENGIVEAKAELEKTGITKPEQTEKNLDGSIEELIKNSGGELYPNLDEEVAKIEAPDAEPNEAASSESISSIFGKIGAAASELVGQSADLIKSELCKGIDETKTQLEGIKDDLSKEAAKDVAKVLGSIENLGKNVAGKTEEEPKGKLDEVEEKKESTEASLKNELESVGKKIDEPLSTGLSKIEKSLGEKIKEDFGNAEASVVGKIEDVFLSGAGKIKETSASIVKDLNQEISKVADEAREGFKDVKEKIEERAENVINGIEDAGKKVDEAAGSLAEEIHKEYSKVTNETKETVEDLGKRIGETEESLENGIRDFGVKMGDSFTVQAGKLEETVGSLSKDIHQDISKVTLDSVEEMKNTKEELGKRIDETKTSVGNQIGKTLEEAEKVVESAAKIQEDLKTKTGEVLQNVEQHLENTAASVETKIEGAGKEIDETVSKGLDLIGKKAEKLEESTESFAKLIQGDIPKVSCEIGEKVEDINKEFKEHVEEIGKNIKSQIEDEGKKLDETVSNGLDEAKKLEESTGSFAKMIQEDISNVSNKTGEAFENLKEKTKEDLDEVKEQIEQTEESAKSKIEDTGKRIEETVSSGLEIIGKEAGKITESAGNFTKIIQEDIMNVLGKTEEAVEEFKTKSKEDLEKVEGHIEKTEACLKSKIEDSAKKLDETVSVGGFAKMIQEDITNVSSKSQEVVQDLKTKTEENLQDVGENFGNSVLNKIEDAGKKLEGTVSSGLDLIGEKTGSLAKNIQEEISQVLCKTEEKIKDIETESREDLQELGKNVEKAEESLKSEVEDAGKKLEETLSSGLDLIGGKAESLTRNVQEDISTVLCKTGEKVGDLKTESKVELQEIKESVKSQVEDAGKKLDEALSSGLGSIEKKAEKFEETTFGSIGNLSKNIQQEFSNIASGSEEIKADAEKVKAGIEETEGIEKTLDSINDLAKDSKLKQEAESMASLTKKLETQSADMINSYQNELEGTVAKTEETIGKIEEFKTDELTETVISDISNLDDEKAGTKMKKNNEDREAIGAGNIILPSWDLQKKLGETSSSHCDIQKGDQTAYLTVEPVGSEKKLSISDVEISFEDVVKTQPQDPMSMSFYGALPSEQDDPLESWGKPLGLPSPAPPATPKKERKLPSNVMAKNKINDDRARSESPSKKKKAQNNSVYVDLTYVPHHGNSTYAYVDFFKRVRARYYVFSGIEPSREVYNALLEAKQTWDDKDLEVTIIPTYDTDVLGYWVAENEEMLAKHKIDLSPSASRCTINLQDHETSCSAYRLEF